MSWIENILLIGGISLDIFAAMEIEGAMLAEVKKKQLAVACTLVAALQLLFFFGGYLSCYYVGGDFLEENRIYIGTNVAAVICALLGVRLIIKAIKREFIHERRREITVKGYIRIIVITSIYTLLAGCACGFVGTNLLYMILTIIICSILVVIAGLYTGYHFGFQSKTVMYVIGAILLWIEGIVIAFF